ncbi:MAG: Clp protease N-terminal domain-containing protein [Candidatus Acidiferrales bacterium]
MFQRYTQKARRVIFFARYEASQYGSPCIDTEHILLGLLREDVALMREALVSGSVNLAAQVRAEFEKVVKRGKAIPTSVEMPLTTDSENLLKFATEEADRLGHRDVGTEHLLLGILRLQDSLAARLLMAKGANPAAIRERVSKRPLTTQNPQPVTTSPLAFLNSFLGALQGDGINKPADFFDERGQFVDSSGKLRIGREKIEREAETLFVSFAKKKASFRIEDTTNGPSETFVASVLWEFAFVSAERSKSLLRMSVVLAPTENEWAIVLAQMTPILLGPSPIG